MARRQVAIAICCGVLAGCSFGSPISKFGFPKFPRVTVPELHFMGVPLYGEKLSVPLVPTKPYQLAPSESEVVRLAVTRSFPDAAKVSFYPLRSGLAEDGTVSVCGMVSARDSEGKANDKLFRGDLVRQPQRGAATFVVKKISGANAATIEVFGDCQKQSLA